MNNPQKSFHIDRAAISTGYAAIEHHHKWRIPRISSS